MKPRNNADRTRYRCRLARETGNKVGSYIYAFTLALLCTQAAFSQELSIKATADRSQIYIGESFNLIVEISGSNDRYEPDLSSLDNCDIKLLGSHDQSRRSISIINGRMSQESYTGRTFTYSITPKTTGLFKTGIITGESSNRKFSTQGPNLTVSGIEKQDFVLVSVTSSKESVLIDETFEITMSIRMKRLPGQFAHYDPMDPRHPPGIEIPYIKEEINGLKSPEIRDILQKRLVGHPSRAGFSINDIELRDKWDLSFFNQLRESNLAKFALDRRDISINGADYYEYSLKLQYTALEEMNHTFGPVVFKGQVITAVDNGGNGSGRPIFAIGPACTVRVVPPPEENRPASYVGAIGENFSASADLDTQTCNLGDPIKLTIELSGDVRLSNIDPPELSNNLDLKKIFRIYTDNIRTETDNGVKKYIYTVRPIKSGTLEIPPIEVSFYDTNENSYKTIYTKAIPLRVKEAVKVSESFIIDTDTNRNKNTESKLSASRLLIAPLAISETGYITNKVSMSHWQVALLCMPPAVYILAILAAGILAKRRSTSESRQRAKDLKSALSIVRKALSESNKNNSQCAELLLEGTRKFIARYFSKPEEGLTPNDVKSLLCKSNLSKEESLEVAAVYENIFNSAYSSNIAAKSITNDDIGCVLKALEKLDSK